MYIPESSATGSKTSHFASKSVLIAVVRSNAVRGIFWRMPVIEPYTASATTVMTPGMRPAKKSFSIMIPATTP